MINKKMKAGYVIALTILSCVAGAGGAWLFGRFFPEHYFLWYPAFPVYFFLFGMGVLLLYVYSGKAGKKSVMLYMGIRMTKLLVSVLLLLLYAFLVDVQIKSVLVTFCIYYVIYMLFESAFFFISEKAAVLQNKDE